MAAVLKHLQEKRRREQMGEIEAKRQKILEEEVQSSHDSNHDSSSECCDSNCSGSSTSGSDDSQDSRLAELKPATPEICQKLVKSELKPEPFVPSRSSFDPIHNLDALETAARNPANFNSGSIPFEVVSNHTDEEPITPDLDDISIHSSDDIFLGPNSDLARNSRFVEEQSRKIDETITQVLAMARDPQSALTYDDARVSTALNPPTKIKIKNIRPAARRRAPNGTRTQHPCGYCPKVFPSRAQFEKHERTHTGEKPYPCNFCDATFGRKDRLRMHIRIHTGEKPHHCENCDSKFTTREQLVKHVKVHTGQKDYICAECDKRFAEKSDLKRHVLIHTDQRPFSCETCSRTFKRKYSLQVHNRLHTGEKPYTCLTCDKAFHTSSHLSSHIQSNHL